MIDLHEPPELHNHIFQLPTSIRLDSLMNNNEKEQVDANGGMSYIDRLVHGLDNDSIDDETSTNPDNFGVDGDDTGRGIGEEEDDDEWSYPEEESTDDEFEYDSDEEEDIKLRQSSPEEVAEFNEFLSDPDVSDDVSDEIKQLQLWRLDKDESFSDWTIQISSSNTDKKENIKTYHVHKTTLRIGNWAN